MAKKTKKTAAPVPKKAKRHSPSPKKQEGTKAKTTKSSPPKDASKSNSSKGKKGKDASNKRYCLNEKCKKEAAMNGYCRLHYITNWKRIKLSEQMKNENRLNAYVDKLVKKYPGNYLDRIKEGLEDEDKFKETIEDLSLEYVADEEELLNEDSDDSGEIIEKLSRYMGDSNDD